MQVLKNRSINTKLNPVSFSAQLPSYKNFKGTIDELGPNQYVISGEVSILDSTTIEITELPVRTWTQVINSEFALGMYSLPCKAKSDQWVLELLISVENMSLTSILLSDL